MYYKEARYVLRHRQVILVGGYPRAHCGATDLRAHFYYKNIGNVHRV